MNRLKLTFAAIILVQAAHALEEQAGRLWESFPPARFVAELVSHDLARGFLLGNVSLVAFGVWCLVWPVRREWPSAAYFMWAWVVLEVINGIGHLLWTLREGEYTPGVATAPVLLALAIYLGLQLLRKGRNRI
jgi:hypothetical protein